MQVLTSRIMLERDVRYIYPEYFDSKLPRGIRKVPLELAVPNPTVEEISMILRAARIEHVIEDKHHPADRYERRGRVAVKKLKTKKRKLLILIAKYLKKYRERVKR